MVDAVEVLLTGTLVGGKLGDNVCKGDSKAWREEQE
jgi:hypothetical protein